MSRPSNYPPGVTGHEPHLTGDDPAAPFTMTGFMVSDWLPDDPTPEGVERLARRMMHTAHDAAWADDYNLSYRAIRTRGEWTVRRIVDRPVLTLKVEP